MSRRLENITICQNFRIFDFDIISFCLFEFAKEFGILLYFLRTFFCLTIRLMGKVTFQRAPVIIPIVPLKHESHSQKYYSIHFQVVKHECHSQNDFTGLLLYVVIVRHECPSQNGVTGNTLIFTGRDRNLFLLTALSNTKN